MEETILEGYVGHTDLAQGSRAVSRFDRQSALLTSSVHGKYAQLSSEGKVYFAASQAATTWSVALTTTYTGLVVWNPVASNVNLRLQRVSLALSVAPAAIAPAGLILGGPTTDLATNGTPLSVYNTNTGAAISTAGKGRASAGCTLTLAPIWGPMFLGGFTAAALFAHGGIVDLEEAFTIPPGYFAGIGALTAAVGFGFMSWTETPV